MRSRAIRSVALTLVVLGAVAASAQDVVFQNVNDNGYFTPFSSSTPAGVKYGDGGWLSNSIPNNFTLVEIDLLLCTSGGTSPGTTDLLFTFNDGDPSGLVFGSGAPLYSTVLQGVTLPAAIPGSPDPVPFTVTIPLPNVQTLGGFNNIGFSLGTQNFNFDGQFGFECSSAYGQRVGYYTNNASYFNGSTWSLFSFGSDPYYGVANFCATIYSPEPTSLVLLALGALALARRR